MGFLKFTKQFLLFELKFMNLLRQNLIRHLVFFLAFAIALLFLRSYEFLYLYFSAHELPSFKSVTLAINFDLFFTLSISFFLIPLMFLNYISQKFASWVYIVLILLLFFIHIGLTHFFLSTGKLLTNVLFDFSLSEMYKVSSAELSWGRLGLWLMYIIILVPAAWILIKKIPHIQFSSRIQNILCVAYLAIFIILFNNRTHYSKSVNYFDNYTGYYFGNNKVFFFLESVVKNANENNSENNISQEELDQQINNFHKLNPDFHFIKQTYPLLHDEPYPNVLGKFFKHSDKKPNIVLLVVEGLAGSFSGDNTFLGHFTPFIDSLAKQSLYWNHFLSNAEHSYGALPNIFASAPSGTNARGLINLEQSFPGQHHYPKHFSLVKLLQQNGYLTRSFYSGELYFDQIGMYMKEIGLNCVLDASRFNSSTYTKPLIDNDASKFSWGYNDKDLYGQAFNLIEPDTNSTPYLDVYVSLTLHSPFNLCTKEYYERDYLEQRLKSHNPNLSEILKKVDNRIISAALFADDALKLFFDEYKKRSDFSNTIFIITGDHRVDSDIPHKSELDYFHVPLLIYSPLESESVEFKGLCSHIDITPSLIELLKNNFGLKFNYAQEWMGKGLDTSSIYHNDCSFSLSLFNSTYPNFLLHNYLISSDQVSILDENFNTKPVTDQSILDSMNAIVKTYRIINKYVITKDKICE